MATVVKYNDVTLYNVVTREWDEQVMFDSTGTDHIGTRFHLAFQAVVHGQYGQMQGRPYVLNQGSSYSGSPAASVYNEIRCALETPRGELLVTVNNEAILHCLPSTGGNQTSLWDIENGPKPRSVKITQIVGSLVFRVSFVIECAMLCCESYDGQIGPVLNNRWSIREDMDAAWYVTRTIRGKLRFASGNPEVLNPAQYKTLVNYPLEVGFKRERISYEVAANGLEADYEVTDRQVKDAAPATAAKMTGTHSEHTDDGQTFVSECTVHLDGSPDMDKGVMIVAAMQVIDNRLNYIADGDGNLDKSCFPLRYSITESIGEENWVEVSAAFRRTPGQSGNPIIDVAGVLQSSFSQPVGLSSRIKSNDDLNEPGKYDPRMSWKPATWGYVPYGDARDPIVLGLIACFWQVPCSRDPVNYAVTKDPDVDTQSDSTDPFGKPDEPSPPDIIEALPVSKNPNFKEEETSKGCYSIYKAETEYAMNTSRVQMQVAQWSDSKDQQDQQQDTTACLNLAQQGCRRIIRVECERSVVEPEIPQPRDTYTDQYNNIQFAMLSHTLTKLAPTLAADGLTQVFRTIAHYEYVMSRPPSDKDKLAGIKLPFLDWQLTDVSIDPEAVYKEDLA